MTVPEDKINTHAVRLVGTFMQETYVNTRNSVQNLLRDRLDKAFGENVWRVVSFVLVV